MIQKRRTPASAATEIRGNHSSFITRNVIPECLESQGLGQHMAETARHLFGDPNRAVSTKWDWRYGRHGSLSVDIRKGVWCDHEAGDGGGVLDLIRREMGLTGRDALEWLGANLDTPLPRQDRPVREPREPSPAPDRIDAARRVWQEGSPVKGTLVETYLASRGLSLPPDPDILRFHPGCPRGAERLPGMLARMTDVVSNEPAGVHRTFLKPDGAGKADGPNKMMLGSAGVIRLNRDDDVTRGLGLSEGIETGLAVIGVGWEPLWAAGSAGGIAKFPVLRGIQSLTIFADTGKAGQVAARECAGRWVNHGCEASIITPPAHLSDFNDLWGGAIA
ncbi:toprim domain-containing protein [Rhodospirillum sp. A1_3_36]|uniref:DUF7146 domain-containing protein n=1 Tax=Rhodospirillum sp. A1_3_36 TaxID=3391666 RepID=UPI0039A68731